MSKQKLFSVTAKDCEWSFYKSGGAGGQKKNKTANCVRCIHRESGATGIGQEGRSLSQNKQTAFLKMIEMEEFKKWHKIQVAKILGEYSKIEENVEKAMKSENIQVQFCENGQWISEDDILARAK